MSQGDTGEGGGTGWLSGWIQSAKEKSTTALNLVKRDLAEFTSTMHDDSVKIAATVKDKLTQENATAATQKVKHGVTSLLGGLSKALVIEPDDDYQMARIVGGEAVVFDRFKARQHAIQVDPTTYTIDPVPEDTYREWLLTFDLESMKGKVSELLVSNVEVRALYTQLVPLTVSNLDFWSRYFFKLQQLEDEEARRMELMKRADRVDGAKELGWDEDDDDDWPEVRGSVLPAAMTDSSTIADLTPVAIPALSELESRLVDGNTTTAAAAVASSQLLAAEPSRLPTDAASDVATTDVNQHPVCTSSTGTDPAVQDSAIASGSLAPGSTTAESAVAASAAVSTGRESVVSSISQSSERSWSAVSSTTDNTKSGDSLVVVGSTPPDRKSPSDESSNTKESLDEDWEKDFDVEVTEQEVQAAKERLMNRSTLAPTAANTQESKGEDWEDW